MSRNKRLFQNNATIQKKSPTAMMLGVVLVHLKLSLLCFSSNSFKSAVCCPSVAVDSVESIVRFRWILPPPTSANNGCLRGATSYHDQPLERIVLRLNCWGATKKGAGGLALGGEAPAGCFGAQATSFPFVDTSGWTSNGQHCSRIFILKQYEQRTR